MSRLGTSRVKRILLGKFSLGPTQIRNLDQCGRSSQLCPSFRTAQAMPEEEGGESCAAVAKIKNEKIMPLLSLPGDKRSNFKSNLS